jgi:hypothetical protein
MRIHRSGGFSADSGQHSNRFRYYDSEIGRYISADPIGQFGLLTKLNLGPEPGGNSSPTPIISLAPRASDLYPYAFNNPLNLIDPSGAVSTTFRLYAGVGFSFTFGFDSQGSFFQVSAGFGLGGGLVVDPNGQFIAQPGNFPCPPPAGSTIGFAGFGYGAGARALAAAAGSSYTSGLAIANQPGSSAPGAPQQLAQVTQAGPIAQLAPRATGASASVRVNLISVGVGGL